MRLLDEFGADAIGGDASVGDDLLRFATACIEGGAMLGQDARGFFTIALGRVDRVLERLLPRLDGLEDGTERKDLEDHEQADEHDQHPRHHAIVGVEQVGVGRFGECGGRREHDEGERTKQGANGKTMKKEEGVGRRPDGPIPGGGILACEPPSTPKDETQSAFSGGLKPGTARVAASTPT